MNTGTLLYTLSVNYIPMGFQIVPPDGPLVLYDSVTRRFHAYNIKTGDELWVTDPIGEYPWSVQTAMRGFAYGNMYIQTYDGHMYAIDLTTGKLTWQSDYTGDTTETVFGTWAFYTGLVIADGKIYTGTTEHTPTQPRIRGNRLFCLDAYTGKFLWNISGAVSPNAIAEGYLISVSENDGIQYCFGKGKTATTVSVSMSPIAKGASTVIQGTVMDESPAQLGTPAIADDCMSGWMDYLHMQKPVTINVQGVPVTLTATAPDGSTINIGETTSDGYGYFMKSWTPPSVGDYKIQATFLGSESYWSSSTETGLSVTTAPSPAVSPSPSPSPSPEAPSMDLYIIAAAAVIIIVVAIAAVYLLKKRAK